MTKMQNVGGVIGGAMLAGVLAFTAFTAQGAPAPQPTIAAVVVSPTYVAAPGPAFDPRPTAAPVTPVDSAPVTPPVAQAPTQGASGDPVPFIPSSDPNNANGGDYVDPGIYCQSGSASTVGGVPVCD